MIEDLLYPLQSIYHGLPRPLRRLAGKAYGRIPTGLRLGASYEHFKSLLAESQNWSREQFQSYQRQALHKQLTRLTHTPRFRRIQQNASADDLLKNWDQLPFMRKEDIQLNLQGCVVDGAKPGLYVTSGGSTGTPVGFYLEKGISRGKELAFMEEQWGRAGYAIGNKCVVIRGHVVDPHSKGRIDSYDGVRDWLNLSSYHLTEDRLPEFVSKIAEFRPRFIQCYPSAGLLLADFLISLPKRPFDVDALFCGSEGMLTWQREKLTRAFGCRVYSWYGHAERLVIAGACEVSDTFHVHPLYGYLELVDAEGSVITKPGIQGEIVATGFDNAVMPMVRYRTSDLAVWADGVCQCGRSFPILKRIDGRIQELIVTRTGRRISMTALNMHSSVFNHVRQFQFVQHAPGLLTFRVVPGAGYGSKDDREIKRQLLSKLGDDVEIAIEIVALIPRMASGKHTFLLRESDGSQQAFK